MTQQEWLLVMRQAIAGWELSLGNLMSISIFMYAEIHLNGVWKSCYPVETFEEDGEISYSVETVYSNDESDGNYPLSRMLLDFDRIRHHAPETSALPRGLPDDLSPELKQFVSWQEENGRFLHFPSWLLLRELLELLGSTGAGRHVFNTALGTLVTG